MARKYYLCGVIGAGTRESPYKSAISVLTVNQVSALNGAVGQCLTLVNATNHAVVAALPGVYALPDVSLDIRVNSIQLSKKTEMRAQLEARGYDPTLADNADGYRDVIRGIGLRFEATFNEDTFDVAE